MSFSRIIDPLSLLAAGLVLGVVFSASGQEAPRRRGRPIQFSEPQSDVVKTNVNKPGPNKATLKDLEQDLKKPFELLNPGESSTDRFLAPTPRTLPSAARARQMKNLLEKRNEWIFLEPEEYFGTETKADGTLDLPEYGRDGREKRTKTPMERHFERVAREGTDAQGATNQATGGDSLNPQLPPEELEESKELAVRTEDKPFGSALGSMSQPLKPLSFAAPLAFEAAESETRANRGFAEIFGFGQSRPVEGTPDQSRSMDLRMQEFKQLLGMGSPTPASPAVSDFNPSTSSSLAAPSAWSSAGFEGLLGDNSRAFSKPLSPGPAAQGLLSSPPTAGANFTFPSWEKTLPAPEPPRMTLPAPTFNVPQRKF